MMVVLRGEKGEVLGENMEKEEGGRHDNTPFLKRLVSCMHHLELRNPVEDGLLKLQYGSR